MKQWVLWIGAMGLVVSAAAQNPSLFISTSKTTSLIFPFSIRHVDRGSKDVLVEQVKEADNILLVKAASSSFPETNLSVITSDGNVYSFIVTYELKPSVWVFQLPAKGKASVSTYAENLLNNPRTLHGIKDNHWEMQSLVSGIYINREVIYYQVKLINQSPLDYDIDYIKFYIRDKNKVKRTSSQELEIVPKYIAGNSSIVRSNSNAALVFALDKFTIPDGKSLIIEFGEKNGSRNLRLKVKNKKILKALPLADFN